MDDNRIKPITPSLARLKYEPNRKDDSEKKDKKKPKNSHESTANNENVFDDFA